MKSLDYLDFDLVVERAGEGYRASVSNAPAGEAVTDFSLPFTEQDLEIFVLRVVTLGRRRDVRAIDSPDVKWIRSFGLRLFETVFDGPVNACLLRSFDQADRQESGLRIRLHLSDVPELANLPWEFLFDQSGRGFLCLSDRSPVLRYVHLARGAQPVAVKSPLRVLAVISSPTDAPQLDVEREWSKLNEALGGLIRSGALLLDRLDVATLEGLQRRLRVGEYHIMHFVGHGGFDERTQDGLLLLEDAEGKGHRVSGQSLGVLLHDHEQLRLVVLNACEGARSSPTDPFAGTAQSLVQTGIPAVIAMQFEITDEAAITMSSEFYSAVADGYPVDAALSEARKAMFTRVNAVEWATPVLYMRSPDGRIFDVERPSPPQADRELAEPTTSPVTVGVEVREEPPPSPPEGEGTVKRKKIPVGLVAAGALVVAAIVGFALFGRGHGSVLPGADSGAAVGTPPSHSVVAIDPGTLLPRQVVPDPGGSGFVGSDITTGLDSVWVLGSSGVARVYLEEQREPVTIQVAGASDLGVGTSGVWLIQDGALREIDLEANALGRSIRPQDVTPRRVAVGQSVWVLGDASLPTSELSDELVRFDAAGTRTGARSSVRGIDLVVPSSGVWIADQTGSKVVRFDGRTIEPSFEIAVQDTPDGIAPSDTDLWIFNTAAGTVTRIDPGARTADAPISLEGRHPVDVAVGMGFVWTANDDGSLSQVNPSDGHVETFDVGAPVAAIAVDRSRGTLWALVE